MKASDVMTSGGLCCCSEGTSAQEIARMMCDHDIGAVPVLDEDGRLEGIVTDRDLACRLVAEGHSCQTPVREIMSTSICSVHPDTDLQQVESLMRERKVRRLPVVDDDDRLQGFISLADLTHHCKSPQEEHELVGVMEAVCTPD